MLNPCVCLYTLIVLLSTKVYVIIVTRDSQGLELWF
jgi:hypothetical protein